MVVLLNGGRIYGEKLFRGVFFLYITTLEKQPQRTHTSPLRSVLSGHVLF
jgi:hypothetical protein